MDSPFNTWDQAFGQIYAPSAFIDLQIVEANLKKLQQQASDKPIRLATKSIRCRQIIDLALANPAFQGLMCYTLSEAIWLAELGYQDILVAYPTTDEATLKKLTSDKNLLEQITLMVDHPEQLALLPTNPVTSIQLCVDIDTSYQLFRGKLKLGAKRSSLSISDTEKINHFLDLIEANKTLEVVGLMFYEAHIAGLPDKTSNLFKNQILKLFKNTAYRQLHKLRSNLIDSVRQRVPELKFVNAGGTGNLAQVARESHITEVTTGSGVLHPTIFDHFRLTETTPAAFFALPVTRKPNSKTVTVLGGGYIASGSVGTDKLPSVHSPQPLQLTKAEGAGEVQTPLTGAATKQLKIGDNVYFRHAKAGELTEHFNFLYVLNNRQVTDKFLTYRGENQCFL